jgi:hypothetical protein
MERRHRDLAPSRTPLHILRELLRHAVHMSTEWHCHLLQQVTWRHQISEVLHHLVHLHTHWCLRLWVAIPVLRHHSYRGMEICALLISEIVGGESSASSSGRFILCELDRRLGGSYSRPGHNDEEKTFCYNRIRSSVLRLLYWLRCLLIYFKEDMYSQVLIF